MENKTKIKTERTSGGEDRSTPDYILQFVRKPPMILKSFHHEDLIEFLKCGHRQQFIDGDTVIHDGTYVSSAFLVVSGRVSIWKDNVELTTLSTGHFLGESFLFNKSYRMAKVVSSGDAGLIEFKRPEILNFFRSKPEKLFNIFTRNIIKLQQEKISSMNGQLYNLKNRLLKDKGW